MADDFEQVYSLYYDAVYGYLLRLSRDPYIAEEVTQEAFFRALKALDKYRGECKMSVWLCQIAKNTYFSMHKKYKRPENIEPESYISISDIEKRLSDKETVFAVHKALHKLPEPYKEVFWLRTFGELEFSRIAELMGKTDSWARVTYYRARLKLKEELK